MIPCHKGNFSKEKGTFLSKKALVPSKEALFLSKRVLLSSKRRKVPNLLAPSAHILFLKSVKMILYLFLPRKIYPQKLKIYLQKLMPLAFIMNLIASKFYFLRFRWTCSDIMFNRFRFKRFSGQDARFFSNLLFFIPNIRILA